MGYPLRPGMGTPLDPGWDTPQTWGTNPHPRPETGYPPDLGLGTPRPGTGYPPRPGTGYPPTSIARSTWYMVGSMPLAFMQEDFLVSYLYLQDMFVSLYLPPASEGWGKGTVFSLSVHTWGGVPHLRSEGEYLVPCLGGTQSQVQGVPSLRSGGYPISGPGGTPSQVWGVPHLRSGVYLISGPGGYPISGLVKGYPISGLGYHPPYPKTDQHSELLLRGGRYASCVHARALSCTENVTIHFFTNNHYCLNCPTPPPPPFFIKGSFVSICFWWGDIILKRFKFYHILFEIMQK